MLGIQIYHDIEYILFLVIVFFPAGAAFFSDAQILHKMLLLEKFSFLQATVNHFVHCDIMHEQSFSM